MTLFFADLVREFSSSTGAGDFVLGGAVPGHRRFAGAVPAGARFHYCIAGVTHPAQWEVGEGEIGSGGSLVRLPFVSSAGGELVAFSPGLKSVALTVAADWYAAQDAGVAIADVPGLEAALTGKAAAEHDHDAAYAPLGHGHDGAYAPLAHGHEFGSLAGRPTTLAGYGITDAAAADHHHDGRYQPLDAELSAIASLSGAADRLAYFTGPGAAATTALTPFGRTLIDDADAAAARGTLGLGSMAGQNADAVAITGGTVSGIASLAVAGTVAATGAIGTAAPSPKGNCKIEVPGDTGTPGYVGFYVNGTSRVGYIGYRVGTRLSMVTENGFTGWHVNGDLSLVGPLLVGSKQVVGARRTGWTAASGTATRTAFDTASVTTAALAERVKALIDDLIAHGLIGS